jgi:hypothetical protein
LAPLAVAGVVAAREPHVVSARGSPAHPRPARKLFVRPIGALPDPSPRPWSPAADSSMRELRPSTRAILARLSVIPDASFGGGPHPLTSGSPASNDSLTVPRRSTSGHYPWPNVTPRFDRRAERRHPCAPRQSTNLADTTWPCLPARNWLCFSARYQTPRFQNSPGRKEETTPSARGNTSWPEPVELFGAVSVLPRMDAVA